MIMDTQEMFSNGQSLIAGTGDLVSTNVLDTAASVSNPQNHDEGIGEEVWLSVREGTAMVAVGGTVQLVLQTASDVAFTTPVEFPLTAALGPSSYPANTFVYQGRLPAGLQRFLRVVYRIAGAAVTAGTADAFITKDIQRNRAYNAGYTVA